KACGGVLAEQSEIGRVRAVTHRQSSAGVVAVGHIAKCGISAESKICKVKQVVTVEACHGATKIGGMVDLQRGVGAGIERNVLAERSTHFESRYTVDHRRACAAHLAVGRDIAAIRPQQPGIGDITMDDEAAATSRFKRAGVDHFVCTCVDCQRIAAASNNGPLIMEGQLSLAELPGAGDRVVYVG